MQQPTQQWKLLAVPLMLLSLMACPDPGPKPTAKFSLSLEPNAPRLVPGGNTNVTVRVTREAGFNGSITLSLDGAPSGVTGSFNPNPTTSDSSILRLEASNSVKDGSYPITVKGVSGDATSSVAATVGVQLLPPSTATVDTSVKPSVPQLKPLSDGLPRPVVAAADAKGNQMSFLQDEIVLSSNDPAQLQAFLNRWNGQVLKTVQPPTNNPNSLKTMHLIRIDPSTVDASRLPADLAELDKTSRADLKLSSQRALHLLAVTAREKASGVPVGLNMVFQGQQVSFEDLNIQEGNLRFDQNPIGTDSTNAAAWPYMAGGTVQNINVVDAWRALERAGKLGNTVKVAVIDGGFFPPSSNTPDPAQSDWPRWLADADEVNNNNEVSCSDTNPCLRHGSDVSLALAGQADNNRGPAGPGAPVTQLILLEQYGDGVSMVESIFEAMSEGAKIINMSFGAAIPAIGAAVDFVGNAVTAAAVGSDVVVIAAAGNAGIDVDAEDCFLGICWEETAHIPCESTGVICVGGLDNNSNARHSSSNFGSKDVDIFGPFCVYVGETALRERRCGTSVASPFVAGVAALVRAANPTLNSVQVRDVLFGTAHIIGSPARRVVHAFGAVKQALGDVPPRFDVTWPPAPGFGDDRNSFSFSALTEDFEGGCCTVTWNSSLEGQIGTGLSLTRTFINGQHTITATATDAAGNAVSRTHIMTVQNRLPEITLTSPNVAAFYLNGGYTFSASATDFGANLPCSSITWQSSVAADIVPASGCTADITFKTLGNRTITVTATDQEGSTASTSRVINVVTPPPSGPPQVQITRPAPNQPFSPGAQIEIRYTIINDPGCAGSCTYTPVWKFKQGTVEKVVTPKVGGIFPNTYSYFIWEDYFPTSCGSGSARSGQLTLEVTDPEGLKGTYTITINNTGCPA